METYFQMDVQVYMVSSPLYIKHSDLKTFNVLFWHWLTLSIEGTDLLKYVYRQWSLMEMEDKN